MCPGLLGYSFIVSFLADLFDICHSQDIRCHDTHGCIMEMSPI